MILLHGYSDDLFCSLGDIEAEFDCWEMKVKFTASDGTRGTAIYENGRWCISISQEGTVFQKHVKSFTDDNTRHDTLQFPDGIPGYSDYILLGEGVEWLNINGRKFKP